MGEFGSIGIGMAYGMLHNAYVLHQYTGDEKFRAAFAIAQDIYEDIFLAGYTPERHKVLEILKNAVPYREFGKTADALKDALLGVGITLAWEEVSEADILAALIVSRNINAAFSNPYVWVGEYAYLVPACKALRGLSSGNKNLIVTPEEWAAVVHLTQENNTLREIVMSCKDIYKVLATVHWSRV